MRKLLLLIELEYDEEIMGDSEEERNWIEDGILKENPSLVEDGERGLILHSNVIGDEVGVVKVLKIIPNTPDNSKVAVLYTQDNGECPKGGEHHIITHPEDQVSYLCTRCGGKW